MPFWIGALQIRRTSPPPETEGRFFLAFSNGSRIVPLFSGLTTGGAKKMRDILLEGSFSESEIQEAIREKVRRGLKLVTMRRYQNQ